MGGREFVIVDTGDHPVDEVRTAVEDVDEGEVWFEDGRLFWRPESAGIELDDPEFPCRRALFFWQNDTTMVGGGTLYEQVDGELVETDSIGDVSYGREAREYFWNEYGIEVPRR